MPGWRPTILVKAKLCWPFTCFVAKIPRARRLSSPFLDAYLLSLVEAAGDWLDGRTSQDYPGYDAMIAKLREATAADQIANGAAWIGSPDQIAATIEQTQQDFGGYQHASLQVNFNMMPLDVALASLRLFAERVMPRFTAGNIETGLR
jgi:alkanesulfonate monooxygenase SsuD/methylene tetrahydromethanopterin reductase-like flavin-dependent oxidoreductase (luciferase family)